MVYLNSDMLYVDSKFVWHFKLFLNIAYMNILSPGQMYFLVIVVFLFQRTLQVLLPDLAAKASPAASALIRTLGKQLNVNRREILINNFKYIFSHLVCSCSKDELERALHYLKVIEYLFIFYSFV